MKLAILAALLLSGCALSVRLGDGRSVDPCCCAVCPPTPIPPTPTAGPPTPDKIKGLPASGPIVATAGQVIKGLHITSPNGPCITVNVPNVRIEGNEIGPCGDGTNPQMLGIVSIGATNLVIVGNVIHDAANAAYLTAAQHPFTFHKNYVYNIRGPFSRGQMIQTNGIKGGTVGSKITCNVSDMMPGVRYGVEHATWTNVEDHINQFDSGGVNSTTGRTEIAYNRLRGGHPTSISGSAINSGDGPSGGNTYSHDNIIVNVRNVGIAIVNGNNHTHDNNRIYYDRNPWPGVDWGNAGCASITGSGAQCTSGNVISNNRIRVIGITSHCEGSCVVTFTNNNWSDTTLTPAMFDEPWPAACN